MAKTTASNLTEKAYLGLRRDILTGRLEPGTPLRISALAAEYEVSASVIREALTRLSGQGLATANPNQGFRVIPLSPEDLADLTNLRIELETMALRSSIGNGSVSWEAEVISAHHVLASTPMFDDSSHIASEEWIAAHREFHRSLGSACGSPRLLGVLATLSDASDVYRQWAVEPGLEEGRDVAAEHRILMETATAREPDRAADALRDHLQRTTDLILEHREITQPSRK